MKGRFYLEQRTRESLSQGIGPVQSGTREGSKLRPGVYRRWRVRTAFFLIADGFPVMKLRARSAVQRNERSSSIRTLAEPHAALAGVKETSDWDWAGAEAEYRKAIGLNPNDATSHHWYSVMLENLGRLNEALAENEKASGARSSFSPD